MSKGGTAMSRTDFLSEKSSFIRGVAKVLDIGATNKTYNRIISTEEEDFKAISSDWEVVGNDMREALEIYGETTRKR